MVITGSRFLLGLLSSLKETAWCFFFFDPQTNEHNHQKGSLTDMLQCVLHGIRIVVLDSLHRGNLENLMGIILLE